MGAFMAVAVSYLTGSWALGVAVAMIFGLVVATIMASGNIKCKADICAIGMGINMFALAITKFLLNTWLKKSGSFADPKIKPIPKVHFAFLEDVPVLGELFNDWCITVWGLRLRAVGRMPMAAQTAGINVDAMKYQAIAISGLIGGLAGAHLSLGYSTMFVENMTSSRGFMGVASMYFGGAHPVFTSLIFSASVIFVYQPPETSNTISSLTVQISSVFVLYSCHLLSVISFNKSVKSVS